jgi:hypothetical protein
MFLVGGRCQKLGDGQALGRAQRVVGRDPHVGDDAA